MELPAKAHGLPSAVFADVNPIDRCCVVINNVAGVGIAGVIWPGCFFSTRVAFEAARAAQASSPPGSLRPE